MTPSKAMLPNPFALSEEHRGFTVKIKLDWKLVEATAQVIIPRVLYMPVADTSGLREGGILSRNLRLTEMMNGRIGDPQFDRMQYYDDGIYSLIRTLMRMPHQYMRGEVPNLMEWRGTLRFVTRFLRELAKATPEQQALFAHEAKSRAAKHARDTDPSKVFARARTQEIGEIASETLPIDPARIDLLVWSSDMALDRRIKGARDIAVNMDYRLIVCTHMLDAVFRKLRWLRANVNLLHNNEEVFGLSNSKRRVRSAARHLRRFIERRLRHFHLRPLRRSVTYIAFEMEACAKALEDGRYNDAQILLRRISRSIYLLEIHRRMEEVLVAISQVKHGSVPLAREQIWNLIGEIKTIEDLLRAPDPVFNEPIELGFQRKVIPDILPFLGDLRGAILMHATRGGNAGEMHALLKAACSPC